MPLPYLFVGITLSLLTQTSSALSQMGLPCPDEFVATATSVESEMMGAKSYSLPKVKIAFATLAALSGPDRKVEKVEVLKYAGLNPKVGKKYRVKLREGKVCSIQQLSELEVKTILSNHESINI